jgi:hypothetical protein
MNFLLVHARCDKIVSVVEILAIFNCASEQMWQISNTYLLNNPNSITVHNHQLFYICKQISHEATTLILNLHVFTNENFHNFRSFGQPIELTIAGFLKIHYFNNWMDIIFSNPCTLCKIQIFPKQPGGTLVKKSRKYMSKTIGCNILVVG